MELAIKPALVIARVDVIEHVLPLARVHVKEVVLVLVEAVPDAVGHVKACVVPRVQVKQELLQLKGIL